MDLVRYVLAESWSGCQSCTSHTDISHCCHYCFLPGEADSSADTIGIPQYPRGDDVTQGLQHILQLLLIHGHWQVGDVQVGGVLLLLLQGRDG